MALACPGAAFFANIFTYWGIVIRIGLNATCFNDRPSGATQRFRGIYGALIRNHPEVEFVIYEPQDCCVASWFAGAPNVFARATPLPSVGRLAKLANGLFFWPQAFAQDRLDLFECFNQPLTKASGRPTVLTIHDVRRVRPGQRLLRRTAASMIYRYALNGADTIITVSNTMRETIEAMHPRGEVVAVYNGLDPVTFSAPDIAQLERTRILYDVPAAFALSVGHLEERKDYPTLIDAIASLRDMGHAVPLIIVGNEGGDRGRIDAAIARHNLGGLVKILSNVSDPALRSLYYMSSLVVFPSIYEGFGIPILEAMAARRPLILSDIAVFREITEQRGLYFPAGDSAALAGRLSEVLASSELRERLVDYGDRRIGDFAFDALAEQILAVYRTLLASARDE